MLEDYRPQLQAFGLRQGYSQDLLFDQLSKTMALVKVQPERQPMS